MMTIAAVTLQHIVWRRFHKYQPFVLLLRVVAPFSSAHPPKTQTSTSMMTTKTTTTSCRNATCFHGNFASKLLHSKVSLSKRIMSLSLKFYANILMKYSWIINAVPSLYSFIWRECVFISIFNLPTPVCLSNTILHRKYGSFSLWLKENKSNVSLIYCNS